MATKKVKKKSSPKKSNLECMSCDMPPRVSVRIEKAKNGYVVNSHDEKYKETTYIAKTKAEAKKHANKMMKI